MFQAYQEQQEDKKEYEQALQAARHALLPPGKRLIESQKRFQQKVAKWRRGLDGLVEEYWRGVSPCSEHLAQFASEYLKQHAPHMIIPSDALQDTLQQVSYQVQQKCQQHPLYLGFVEAAASPEEQQERAHFVQRSTKSLNQMWLSALMQTLSVGTYDLQVPHPAVLPYIVAKERRGYITN